MDKYNVIGWIDPRKCEFIYVLCCEDGIEEYFHEEVEGIRTYIAQGNTLSDELHIPHRDFLVRMIEAQDLGDKLVSIKFAKNISKDAAYALEMYLVEVIGRKSIRTGPLVNKYPGGNIFFKGLHLSESTKKSFSTLANDYPEISQVIENFSVSKNGLMV